MRSAVTLDSAGRIVLPKGLRDQLRLAPGDTLDVALQEEAVILRPRRAPSPMRKERGIWVFSTGRPMAAEETAEVRRDIRAQRAARDAGETR